MSNSDGSFFFSETSEEMPDSVVREEEGVLSYRMADIYEQECLINEDNDVYLITWSPDPVELPDSDIYYQNQFNVNLLADFLKTCDCGVFCVEVNQQGNVHYHGWYQPNVDMNVVRSVYMKVIRRYGLVKITKARTIKKNSYSEKSNGLYYYKKELSAYTSVIDGVITKDSRSHVDWNTIEINSFFTKVVSDKKLSEKMSDRKYYLHFYADSMRA